MADSLQTESNPSHDNVVSRLITCPVPAAQRTTDPLYKTLTKGDNEALKYFHYWDILLSGLVVAGQCLQCSSCQHYQL